MSQQIKILNNFHYEDSVRKIKYRHLGASSLLVSPLSIGSGQISWGVKFTPALDAASFETPVSGHEEKVKVIQEAVKHGINYIDTAPFYGAGKAEIIVGEAIKSLPRESYYIATKVGRNENCEFNYTREEVNRLVNNSLRKLHVDYIDVVQVHDVEFIDVKVVVDETLPALDELRRQGKIRHIGITGYPLEPLKQVIDASTVKIDQVLSYCRHTLFDNSLLKYIDHFRSHKLGVINAAVHGMNLLTGGELPDWHPAGQQVKVACTEASSFCRENQVDLAALTLGHALNSPHADTTLIGMNTLQILKSNLRVLLQGLTEKEKSALNHIKQNIMSKVTVGHWEGVELDKYKKDPQLFESNLKASHGS